MNDPLFGGTVGLVAKGVLVPAAASCGFDVDSDLLEAAAAAMALALPNAERLIRAAAALFHLALAARAEGLIPTPYVSPHSDVIWLEMFAGEHRDEHVIFDEAARLYALRNDRGGTALQ